MSQQLPLFAAELGRKVGSASTPAKADAARANGELGGRPPTVNPDGVSIKGCSIIYAPAGQAGEYAPLATNPYRGCGHKCSYCYVPQVIKISRQEFDTGAVERPGFIEKLTRDAAKYQRAGINEQVMMSFTTDPYHPGDTGLTRRVIGVLQAYGLAVCTLTKGGKRALRDIDLFRPDRDAFASTLTSLDDARVEVFDQALRLLLAQDLNEAGAERDVGRELTAGPKAYETAVAVADNQGPVFVQNEWR